MKTSCFVLAILFITSCSPRIPDVEIEKGDKDLFVDRLGLLHNDRQLYSGYLLEYYPDGELKSRAAYLDGKLETNSYGYYPDGQLMYERSYVNGEKQGIHKGYYPDGRLKFEYHFEAGRSIGNHKEWYEDGQLAADLNYKDGQPFGSQKMWRPDGKIRSNYVIREDGRRYGLVGLKRCKNIDIEKEEITKLSSAIYDK